MKKVIVILLLIGALLLIFIREQPEVPPKPATLLLADYDFINDFKDRSFGFKGGDDQGVHWFEEGFAQPLKEGVWLTGKRSVLHLYLLGRRVKVHVECYIPSRLNLKKQTLQVFKDKKKLKEITFTRQDKKNVLSFEIPKDQLKKGHNKLVFNTKHQRRLGLIKGRKAETVSLALTRLRVEADLTSEEKNTWDQLLADQPQLTQETLRFNTAAIPSTSPTPQPDVLLFLLDAARPDHMSCYGYSRKTTPNIDQLAENGILFKNAFSTASFTNGAVPCLLTGRSWKDYRIFSQRKTQAATMAETLKSAGYATFGFTANANVSRAQNAHLGFDEWFQVWTIKNTKELKRDPLEHLYFNRIRQELPPAPAFVYLHLLPPHQPYYPGKRHDLWKPESYQGPVDGSSQNLKDLNSRKLKPNQQDQERLISLYDGNYHKGDASLGRMLKAWRNLKRDRELLVIVLSDHGEAFGEHGPYGHSTTVYDEMMRIPLLFYPKKLCAPLVGKEEQLVSITDVKPLLMNLLKIPPLIERAYSSHFLELIKNPLAQRPSIIMRSGSKLNFWGLRTEQHLAISNGWGVQELYDLIEDPKALKNLRLQDPSRFAQMTGALRFCLKNKPSGGSDLQPKISEEGRKYLEEIGY